MAQQNNDSATSQRDNFPTFRVLASKLRRRAVHLGQWFWRHKRRFAGAFLVLAVLWVSANIYASLLLNRELAEIKQRGEPLTLAELAPPAVPDSENAAVFYERAGKMMEKLDARSDDLYYARHLSTQERRKILNKYGALVPLFLEGAKKSQCRFSTAWNGPSTALLFPHFGYVRKGAELLKLHAIYNASSGNLDAALRDVDAIFRMSDHAASDPVMLAFINSLSIEESGFTTLQSVTSRRPLTQSQWQRVQMTLRRNDLEKRMIRALQGERAFALSAFNEINQDVNYADLWGSTEMSRMLWFRLISMPVSRFLWRPMSTLDFVWLIRSQPATRYPNTTDETEIMHQLPWYAYMTKILTPVYGRAEQRVSTTEARRRMADIVVALHRYKSQYGKFPLSLRVLEKQIGKVPHDPFNKQPFKYKRSVKDFVLYSVGQNQKDDGGVILRSSAQLREDVNWLTREYQLARK